ncbi:MAG: sulfite exporter TauE/SafE family protein, partial [Alphaproteobacteria bacterium]
MTPAEPLYLAILILTGAFTGIISGLLGVGGG